MWHLGDVFSKNEKKLILGCVIIAIISFIGLFYHFYKETGIIIALDKNTYSESFLGDIGILNPLFILPDSPEDNVSSFVFSSLIKRDVDGVGYIGDIAKDYSISEDGKTFTFNINQNIKWHDGNDFKVEDILFTFDLLRNEEFYSKYREVFKDIGVTARSDSIEVKIPNVDIFFMDNFTFPVLPKHLLENLSLEEMIKSGFSNQPVGTGPYKYKSLEPMNTYKALNLIRNDSYYGQIPQIEKIAYYFFTDEENYRENRTKFSSITNTDEDFDIDDSSFNLNNIKTSDFQVLFFNTEAEILKNPVIRESIKLGLDFELDEDSNYSIINRTNLFRYEEKDDDIIKDPKELLYGIGWQKYTKEFNDDIRRNIKKEKLSLKLVTLNESFYLEIASQIKEKLYDLGIELEIAGLSKDEIAYEYLPSGNYELLLIGLKISNTADLYPYLHSTQIKSDSGLNFSKYMNLETDLLLEDLRMSLDEDRTVKVKDELIKRLERDIPMIFISEGSVDFYLNKEFVDARFPSLIHDFRDIYMFFSKWNKSIDRNDI